VPLNVPASLTIGISTNWIATHPTYKSDEWTLAVNIAGAETIPTAIAVEDDGWLVTVDGANTANLDPGEYYWSARVVDGDGIGRSIGAGNIKLLANLATVDVPYDGRSPSKKILDGLIQAFQDMQGGKISSYGIEGRNVTYRSLDELTKAIDYWQRRVNAENDAARVAQGLPSSRTRRVSFIN